MHLIEIFLFVSWTHAPVILHKTHLLFFTVASNDNSLAGNKINTFKIFYLMKAIIIFFPANKVRIVEVTRMCIELRGDGEYSTVWNGISVSANACNSDYCNHSAFLSYSSTLLTSFVMLVMYCFSFQLLWVKKNVCIGWDYLWFSWTDVFMLQWCLMLQN